MDRIKISLPIVVEGKYDKIKLSNFVDGIIITTDGFGVFKDKEKQKLISLNEILQARSPINILRKGR